MAVQRVQYEIGSIPKDYRDYAEFQRDARGGV